jgi:hypothetical protein
MILVWMVFHIKKPLAINNEQRNIDHTVFIKGKEERMKILIIYMDYMVET